MAETNSGVMLCPDNLFRLAGRPTGREQKRRMPAEDIAANMRMRSSGQSGRCTAPCARIGSTQRAAEPSA